MDITPKTLALILLAMLLLAPLALAFTLPQPSYDFNASGSLLRYQPFNRTWLIFDGVDDAINLSTTNCDSCFNNDWSISVWLNPSNITNNVLPRVWEKRASFLAIMGNVSNGKFSKIALEIQNTTGSGTSEYWSITNLTLNAWQHLVVFYNSSQNNATWYFNGAFDGNARIDVAGGAQINQNISGFDSLLAKRRQDNARNFNGSIDDFRIYNRVLTTAEITNIYNTQRARNISVVTDFQEYNPIDENTGSTVYEINNSNRNGTISSSPVWTTDNIYLNTIGNITITHSSAPLFANGTLVSGSNLRNAQSLLFFNSQGNVTVVD